MYPTAMEYQANLLSLRAYDSAVTRISHKNAMEYVRSRWKQFILSDVKADFI